MNSDEHLEEDHFVEGGGVEDSLEEGSLLSLNQVAEALGVSNPTARRFCMSGKLAAVKVLVNEQLCWKVKPQSLKAYQDGLITNEPSEESSKNGKMKVRLKGASSDEKAFTMPSSGDFPMEAHLAALDTARRALERLERIESQLEEQRERTEIHRSRAEQVERQKLALEMELRQYQAALSEQSESLAEARAEKQAAELQLAQQLAPPPVELLKIETHRPTFGQRVKGWFGFKAAR